MTNGRKRRRVKDRFDLSGEWKDFFVDRDSAEIARGKGRNEQFIAMLSNMCVAVIGWFSLQFCIRQLGGYDPVGRKWTSDVDKQLHNKLKTIFRCRLDKGNKSAPVDRLATLRTISELLHGNHLNRKRLDQVNFKTRQDLSTLMDGVAAGDSLEHIIGDDYDDDDDDDNDDELD